LELALAEEETGVVIDVEAASACAKALDLAEDGPDDILSGPLAAFAFGVSGGGSVLGGAGHNGSRSLGSEELDAGTVALREPKGGNGSGGLAEEIVAV
jgi:hypothetical protein